MPYVNGSSGEIVFPEKNEISEAMGLLQQCTKVHMHGLGVSAAVLYDTVMAYVTCVHERRPVDSVKPMFDPMPHVIVTRHTSHVTRHTSNVTLQT